MDKPTYADIARHAGVGIATVERVLNGRGGVRAATAERVILAARALDWSGRLPERHRGVVRIEVMLVRPESSFYARLAAAFRRIAASLDPVIHLHLTFVDEDDPTDIAARIADPSLRRSGLVISCPDRPAIRTALSRSHEAGLPIVQVVTETLPGAAYVGIDNYAAGRVAGLMMARLGAVRGPVLALCHSQVYRVQRDRLRGFSDYLAEHAPVGPAFVYAAFAQDDQRRTATQVAEALARWPDLAGVYNAGGANTGALEVLRTARRRVFFVGHELTQTTRAALRDGWADVILDQRPEAQARRALDLMLARIGLIDVAVDPGPIAFTTLTSENV